MKIVNGICFDDVLLIPKYSEIKSRSDVNLSVKLHPKLTLDLPIVSANMRDVTGVPMAATIANLGGLGLLHRFMSHEEIVNAYKNAVALMSKDAKGAIGCSIGVQESDKELTAKIVDAGCNIICIDVAHADSKICLDMCQYISAKYPEVVLIAGTIATAEGANRLYNCGAKIIRSGIGGGSRCSTRIETGNGVPSLTSLENVFTDSLNPRYYMKRNKITEKKYTVIADGGLRRAGDIVKALCFSDAVMLGNLLAGTDEANGALVVNEGNFYKEYAGSSTYKNKHIEGIKGLVPCKGPVSNIVETLMQGLRSGCSYQGVSNLVDLKLDPQFVSITHAGLIESHPHDLKVNNV